ncbi:TlpA family protein disulfide reductase [Sphingobacterium thalpophilum]|uniref:TlpA family protein disulfide reductase n=1 Tax=Sphingobacterium thalpophilum TaxID=259 RepID=UPI0024A65FB1|nr:TlpA disulfide reductase family protein [Sphingobacterium thalpophilum]
MNTLKFLVFLRGYITCIFQALVKHRYSTDIVLFTQQLRKQIYKGKTYFKSTCLVLRKCRNKRGSSTVLRGLFGKPSSLLRTSVGTASTLVRQLFDCASTPSRSLVEAGPKASRSLVEHVPTESRRGLEASPKAARRKAMYLSNGRICTKAGDSAFDDSAVNSSSSSTFLLTNFALSSALVRAGHRSCMHFSSGFLRVDSMKSRCRPDENPMNGRSWSGVGRYLSIPLSYRECTEKVLKRYRRATKKLLEIYQRGTKQLQAFGSFLVKLGYKLRTGSGSSLRVMFGRSIRRADVYRLKLSSLQVFCAVLIGKGKYLVARKKSNALNALKCVRQFGGYRKAFRMSLACVFLVSMFSLSAQTPRRDSGADGLSDLVALKPGDKIPDAVWNRPLELNYFNGKKKTIKFAELKGKLILLDFWSTGCPACISGIPNLELIRDRFKGDIEILMINSKRNRDTPKRIENRFKKYKTDFNYVPTIATLLDDTLFTKLFNHNTLPSQVVINPKGEFLALLSGTAQLTDRNIKKILYENDNPLNSEGIYLNKIDGRRNFEVLITDTAGLSYSSSFSNYREHYIPIGPLWKAQKNNSLLIMGNLSLQNFMTYIFKDELEGFAWTDYVFDPRLGLDFKYRLFNTAKENTFWYQFYRNDSIAEAKAIEVARQDFMRYFDVSVQRKSDSISIYKVSFSKAIDKIKTKGQMMIIRRQERDQELLYQNVPIDLFLRNLFYFFESPLHKTGKEAFRIDITIPPGFIHWEEDEKITFLRNNGIILTPVREKREFAYIYSLK